MQQLNQPNQPLSKVLFLGYTQQQTSLIDALIEHDVEVWHTQDKIESTAGFDVVISFGYRHIIKKSVIASSSAPIVNLHISYLPYNRGAHPNFWSFFDGTPSGVTIHLIDEGIDTGAILFQKQVKFAEDEVTFAQTYQRLIREIEALFVTHLPTIVTGTFVAKAQMGVGTSHRLADLPKEFNGWDSVIKTEIERLK